MCVGKKSRQQIICDVIKKQVVSTQDDLLALLRQEGIEATQATISRDIRELGIFKIHDNDGIIRYAVRSQSEKKAPKHVQLQELFQDSVVSVTHVEFMNVVTTSLGTANVVAAELDLLEVPEIVGSLAGTDTIVLISANKEDALSINQRLQAYL